MSEQERAAELLRLRKQLADLESRAAPHGAGPDAPPQYEPEIARLRAEIADLEAELGI